MSKSTHLLFRAVAESVEEAVVNALLGAESMVAEPQTVGSGGAGAAGQVGVSLPADRLAELLAASDRQARSR